MEDLMGRLRRFMEEINQIDRLHLSSMRKNYACLLDLRIYVYIVIHGMKKKNIENLSININRYSAENIGIQKY